MGTREKVLIGVAVTVAAADALAARHVYHKKKAIVMRDMALHALDEKRRTGREKEPHEAEIIPIT